MCIGAILAYQLLDYANNWYLFNRETEPNWVQELEADIKDECSQYGQISHVNVNDDSLVCLLTTPLSMSPYPAYF